ncbi:MAG: hypothetical protein IJ576_01770 [Synergistaceae bacterium]|nr:hypothetical protein [Synergistaceae bacterium]
MRNNFYRTIIFTLLISLNILNAAVYAEAAEDNLIDTVRNYMYYTDYPSDVGYLAFGRQLEKFFQNGEWSIENDKEQENNFGSLAVFKGIGRYAGRRAKITVKIGRAKKNLTNSIREGNLAIVSIYENNNRLYYYGYDRESYGGNMQAQLELDMLRDLTGMLGVSVENKLKLSSFLSTLYSD